MSPVKASMPSQVMFLCVAQRTWLSPHTDYSVLWEMISVLLGVSNTRIVIPHDSPRKSSGLEADLPQTQLFHLEFSIP